jgi:hypothetical protein
MIFPLIPPFSQRVFHYDPSLFPWQAMTASTPMGASSAPMECRFKSRLAIVIIESLGNAH